MKMIKIFIVFNTVLCFGNCNIYKELPSIFFIDNYEKCQSEGKIFCKTTINLKPTGENTSRYWKLIQHSIDNDQAYNHDELFHAVCTNRTEIGVERTISERYRENFKNFGLNAVIKRLNCGYVSDVNQADLFDWLWLLFCTSYIIYILIATYWDAKNEETSILSHNFGTYLRQFSLVRNFKKFKNIPSSEDFQKLKSIQGIRFYNMLLIIFCHTFSSYIGGYVDNTDYIENIPDNTVRHGIRNLLVYLVQTFFLFSAFLMSYHFFQIVQNRENDGHKPRIIYLSFVNRYLRLVPLIIVMIGMGGTIWILNIFKGPFKDAYADAEYIRCRKNWWSTLSFIHNHHNYHESCFFTTWYLAADTQLYVLSLSIMGAAWIYRKNVKYYLGYFFILGVLIPSIVTYVYDLDFIFRINPENSKMDNFRSFKFNAMYSSTYCNMATYMLGLTCGYAYLHLKNVEIPSKTVTEFLWFTSFFGLPVLVLGISSYHFSRLTNALLSGILKPIYALGIGIGVFGISKGLGGLTKKICEWKPAVLLGKLTYSTYIVHYGIVFHRTAVTTKPLYISDYVLLKSFIGDATISFFFGFLVYLVFETPASNMQNLLVPQVRHQRAKTEVSKDK
ncbi:O-acyltransferase like protein-like [Diorhabda sublineata]|uniref:O-acyltransferase like protein-like n=1 Tax=Diorhabda sublineata TaxID=1163346 RepID=UPI0024E11526|nr:O-acyltransferase like protein-like [Diorhabda sublineata]